MDKAAAEQLVLSQWRMLPADRRKTVAHAVEFAERMSTLITFETFGRPESIIRAWIVRDLQASQMNQAATELGQLITDRAAAPPQKTGAAIDAALTALRSGTISVVAQPAAGKQS